MSTTVGLFLQCGLGGTDLLKAVVSSIESEFESPTVMEIGELR